MNKSRWHTTFLGVKQQHCYWLYKVIDDVIASNPQLRCFVEIGTGNGALSVILALHAFQRNRSLITIDKFKRNQLKLLQGIFKALFVRFIEHDCFGDYVVKLISSRKEPTFLMCDGGDKPKEFNTFAPLLPPGSVIAAHDYGTEINALHIMNTVMNLKLEPLFQDEWNAEPDYVQCCFYKVPL